ncbi:MAG: 3-hydroxybutyryl-CoA dehydrogenase [Myxococcales bacterium]|nr:3-hydroxybutyryl-CoA dehydrogenase [Myxococcales bacterium]
MNKINNFAVIGGGQMGSGIAIVLLRSGFKVTILEVDVERCEIAFSSIKKNIHKMHEKGIVDSVGVNGLLRNVKCTTEISDISNSEFVIEAIPENINLKMELFKKLDANLDKEVIIASNTSSLSITDLAKATSRPDKVIGMHFMNPAQVMKGVEVVRGINTSENTVNIVVELIKKIGKEKIMVNDSPGFVVNRILMPMINEAIHVLNSGTANAEDIDLGMKLSCNLPMGPLTLADFIGLDTVEAILNVLHAGLGDERYKPSPLLSELVKTGKLGKKSGEGFYVYKGKI